MSRAGRISRLRLALAAAALAGFAQGCPAPGSDSGVGAKQAAAPESAPGFTLAQLGGSEVSLASLRGKTVVIDFWATWCPPCEFQVPELNAVFEAHRATGDLAVLGISVDTDSDEVVSAWAEEKGVRYPILRGDDGLARKYGALGFPTLVVVTPEGRIHSRHVGLIERDELEEELRSLAAGS